MPKRTLLLVNVWFFCKGAQAMKALTNRIAVIHFSMALVLLVQVSVTGQEALLDWPTLLHDPQLSARSHLQGNIIAPRVAWSYSLGLGRPEWVHDPTREGPVLLDLNGDGISEKIECTYGGTSFSVYNGATNALLWSAVTEQPIYEQLFSVADVNADSILDLCLVIHFRAEVYHGVTGVRLHKISWNVGATTDSTSGATSTLIVCE
jgi:hypothetical protein